MKNTSRHAYTVSMPALMILALSACTTVLPLADDSQAVKVQQWRCGDILLETQAIEEGLILRSPGGDHRLRSVAAASGARYTDDSGQGFWSKGAEEARLWLDAKAAPLECRPSAQGSPWLQAQREGMQLRAAGNEPGWLLEAHAGGPLVLWLDYGRRRLSLHTRHALSGAGRFAATTEDQGQHLTIEVEETTCRDSMSGTRFPLQVRVLREDAPPLDGCGRAYPTFRDADT
ncbi:MAG: MliC family protein [Algiphilus sp.]